MNIQDLWRFKTSLFLLSSNIVTFSCSLQYGIYCQFVVTRLRSHFLRVFGLIFQHLRGETKPAHPDREKNAKICKISGEKLVFSPQISYIILRWNAVNAVKLCKFTARLSGDLRKIHHNSPLKYVISPPLQGSEPLTSCMSSTSSSTAPSLTKFYYFWLNINRIHSTFCKTYAVNFCKICNF